MQTDEIKKMKLSNSLWSQHKPDTKVWYIHYKNKIESYMPKENRCKILNKIILNKIQGYKINKIMTPWVYPRNKKLFKHIKWINISK